MVCRQYRCDLAFIRRHSLKPSSYDSIPSPVAIFVVFDTVKVCSHIANTVGLMNRIIAELRVGELPVQFSSVVAM